MLHYVFSSPLLFIVFVSLSIVHMSLLSLSLSQTIAIWLVDWTLVEPCLKFKEEALSMFELLIIANVCQKNNYFFNKINGYNFISKEF